MDERKTQSEFKIGSQEDWAKSIGILGVNFGGKFDYNEQVTANQR